MDAPGPSTTSTVSASGVEAIEATIEVTPLTQISEWSLDEIYEVERTAQEVLKGGWTKVCLQFPDELLHDSVPVFQAIRPRLPAHIELYVMADTTYGSCCVDEVAAQHVDADFVVHYGHACLTAPARLPVLYIFPKALLDSMEASTSLLEQLDQEKDAFQERKYLLLLCDVAYHYKLAELGTLLEEKLSSTYSLVTSSIDTNSYLKRKSSRSSRNEKGKSAGLAVDPTKASCCTGLSTNAATPKAEEACDSTGSCSCSGRRQIAPAPPTSDSSGSHRDSCRRYTLPADAHFSANVGIIYVGAESLTLTNLLLSHSSTPVLSYDPHTHTSRLESSRTNKMLMKRYGVVQKARDADVIGIVVGTLGVSSYLSTLEYLRKLLKKHHKKSYTMAVGKLTPAKLGNFLEVEAWVLVACGENSLVEGYKDFLKPIVTPWELEVALGEREWITGGEEGQYTLDFTKILRDSKGTGDTHDGTSRVAGSNDDDDDAEKKEKEEVSDEDAPIFSTVTGTYRYRRKYGDKGNVKDASDLATKAQALAIRNQESALASVLSSAGGEHLATRIYRGLDPRYGQDVPSVIEQGRTGIARQYGGDKDAAASGHS